MNRIIFGSLEPVSIPSLGLSDVLAKVDTGAWSGAIHCTNIYQDDDTLHFTPLGDETLATSVTDFTVREVRSALGETQQRYVISVTLVVKDNEYHTTLGLSDRTLMRREMLIGRKFLLENNILVDVTLSRDDDHEVEIGVS